MADQGFLYEDLTYAIIGAAMEVHFCDKETGGQGDKVNGRSDKDAS